MKSVIFDSFSYHHWRLGRLHWGLGGSAHHCGVQPKIEGGGGGGGARESQRDIKNTPLRISSCFWCRDATTGDSSEYLQFDYLPCPVVRPGKGSGRQLRKTFSREPQNDDLMSQGCFLCVQLYLHAYNEAATGKLRSRDCRSTIEVPSQQGNVRRGFTQENPNFILRKSGPLFSSPILKGIGKIAVHVTFKLHNTEHKFRHRYDKL